MTIVARRVEINIYATPDTRQKLLLLDGGLDYVQSKGGLTGCNLHPLPDVNCIRQDVIYIPQLLFIVGENVD